MEPINIAILLACYNRKQTTLRFFENFFKQKNLESYNIDVYLLDDGSTDGTAEAVDEKFKNSVNIISADGNLFWAGGMRKVWNYAMAQKQYNLYLLVNDDIILFDDALDRLINNYYKTEKNGVIVVGSTLSPALNKFSYGGYKLYNSKSPRYYAVPPDEDDFIPCDLANANVLLIDDATVNKIGTFSTKFTHLLADHDYTLTANESGIKVLIAPGYYAYCENDHGRNWLPGSMSLKKRIKYLYSPKGLAYNDYQYYIKKHFGSYYLISAAKLWLKTLFPFIWDKFKKSR